MNRKDKPIGPTLIKGNPNFPVIDTTYYNGIYAIAMRELNNISFSLLKSDKTAVTTLKG